MCVHPTQTDTDVCPGCLIKYCDMKAYGRMSSSSSSFPVLGLLRPVTKMGECIIIKVAYSV
jgi:hypothetical protein